MENGLLLEDAGDRDVALKLLLKQLGVQFEVRESHQLTAVFYEMLQVLAHVPFINT